MARDKALQIISKVSPMAGLPSGEGGVLQIESMANVVNAREKRTIGSLVSKDSAYRDSAETRSVVAPLPTD
jgi:hypothetical protein